MQINIGSWKLTEDSPNGIDQEGLTCDGCGKTFPRPILARVSSSGHVQTYQACPHCMTKVHGADAPKSKATKTAMPSKEAARTEPAVQAGAKCGHFFGYLNKRAKGTSVPERCLICEKMVECLYG